MNVVSFKLKQCACGIHLSKEICLVKPKVGLGVDFQCDRPWLMTEGGQKNKNKKLWYKEKI